MGEHVVGLQSAIADERMASATSDDVGVCFEMMQSPPEVICFSVYNWMYWVCYNTAVYTQHNPAVYTTQHSSIIEPFVVWLVGWLVGWLFGLFGLFGLVVCLFVCLFVCLVLFVWSCLFVMLCYVRLGYVMLCYVML